MSEQNASVLSQWFEEVWNKGNEKLIYEILVPETVTHGVGEDSKGPDAFKVFYDGFKGEFPKVKITVEQVVREGDFEAARCSVEGEHNSGKKVNFSGMCMVRVKDGKILEAWNNFDFETMNKQLI